MSRSRRFTWVLLLAAMLLNVSAHRVWAVAPPAPPTLTAYPSLTTASGLWFSGTREANTSVWVNGVQAVASSASTSWTCYRSLVEGINTLSWTAKRSTGELSAPVVATVRRDSTVPTTPVVTDDGTLTTDGTRLHATWQTSDAGSGVNSCEVKIGAGAGSTSIMWPANVGDVREYTKSGLSLLHGWSYHFSVRTKDSAGNWSSWGYSDGIKYDAHLPVIGAFTPAQGAMVYVGDPVALTTTASDADNDSLNYRYLIDGSQVYAWSSFSNYTWTPQTAHLGRRVVRAEVKDFHGGTTFRENAIYVLRKPIPPPTP